MLKLDDMEAGVDKSLVLQELWKRFAWPATRWSRLQMLRLREDERKKVGASVREAVLYAASSMWLTDHDENGGNCLRRRESHHSAGYMSHPEKMHQFF